MPAIAGCARRASGSVRSSAWFLAGALVLLGGRLQQEQPVSDREDLGGLHVAGGAQGSQALGLGPEYVGGGADQGLADHAGTVGVRDQPRACHIPAGQPPDRDNAALQPERAQLAACMAWR
jgi:hypothetical protein